MKKSDQTKQTPPAGFFKHYGSAMLRGVIACTASVASVIGMQKVDSMFGVEENSPMAYFGKIAITLVGLAVMFDYLLCQVCHLQHKDDSHAKKAMGGSNTSAIRHHNNIPEGMRFRPKKEVNENIGQAILPHNKSTSPHTDKVTNGVPATASTSLAALVLSNASKLVGR